MMVRDRLSDRTLPIRARVTLNAAGSQAGVVMRMFGVKRPFPLLKAMNLVTSRPASDIALAAPTADGRMLTLVPWKGHAIVGTGQSPRAIETLETSVTATEVDAFVAEANRTFPALQLTRADIRLVHRGLLPAATGREGAVDLMAAPIILDHAAEGAEGAITIIGVKYVSARGVAERVVDTIARRLGKRLPPSRSGSTVLPGAGIADHEGLAIETARKLHFDAPLATLTHLSSRYAEAAAGIIRLMVEREELRAPVGAGSPTVGAEIVHVIRHEMAVRLADIVVRRTGLGAAGHPGAEAVAACARIAAGELGWTPAHEAAEIAAVDRVYEIKEN
jgi:glycerol-3-phosphate dehydrogenase